MRLILAFWSAKPIWRPKKPKLMFHRPAKPCRGFSIAALPLVAAGAARVSRGLCRAVEEGASRSEEHTSELQSLMRISYAVFCLKTKKTTSTKHKRQHS